MGVIYLQDRSPWEQLGGLAGLWAGNRLQKLQNISDAKKYAASVYGESEEPQQAGLLSTLNGQQQQPKTFTGDALENASPHYQPDTQQQQAPKASASAPDRDAVRKSVRAQAGRGYVNLIRSGMTPEDARASMSQKLMQDEQMEWNRQVKNYRDTVLEPARQDILRRLVYTQDKDGNTIVGGYDPQKLKGMATQIAGYNYRAQQLGLPTLDMNELNNINSMDKPNISYKTMPNGALVGIDGATGRVRQMGNYAAPADPRQKYIKTDNGLYDLETASVVPGTAPVKYAPGTSGYNEQYLKSLTALLTEDKKAHATDTLSGKWDETMSPYYKPVMEALSLQQRQQSGGSSTLSSSGQSYTIPPERIEEFKDRIMESYSQYGPEETRRMLAEKGLTEYLSWVPK